MLGAIIGDIVGSVYEFAPIKRKDFPLFTAESRFTDDTVMTVAVAEALMGSVGQSPNEKKAALIATMQKWGRRYPDAGYGQRFALWLRDERPKPYRSWGNGAAMRVSAAGWLLPTINDVTTYARLSAAVSHNHPEGVRGAEAVAVAVFLLRNGKSKTELRNYIRGVYGYDLSFTLDAIRPGYGFDVSSEGSVPQAIVAFLESDGFEDCLRNAVSLGGDADTLAAIAGSMAEAHYGIDDALEAQAMTYLGDDIVVVYEKFKEMRSIQ